MSVSKRRSKRTEPSTAAGRLLRAMHPITGWSGRRQELWRDATLDGFELLATLIEERRHAAASPIHGWSHWCAVAAVGCRLAAETTGADMGIALLFALLHDVERLDDGGDPQHGARAAGLVRLIGTDLGLSTDGVELLADACLGHNLGGTSTNPTIGVCWDADRLNLPRVGIEPTSRYLSTRAARTNAWRKYGREICFSPPPWEIAIVPMTLRR